VAQSKFTGYAQFKCIKWGKRLDRI